MGKALNLMGEKFGRLVVLEDAGRTIHKKIIWMCKCDCGNIVKITSGDLRSGHAQSCGCFQRDMISAIATTHGLSNSNEFRIWHDMRRRCLDPKNKSFPNYGGRGIKVCDRWKNSVRNFFTDMGPRPSKKHTLERRNNDRGYEPMNCYWATRKVQNSNTRRNKNISFNGRTQNVAAWAAELGMEYLTLWYRLFDSKWSVEKALTTPVRQFQRSGECG